MLRFIYTVIYYLCAPLLCLRWVYKSFKSPQYGESIRERFGFVKKQSRTSVWFHAVSMGESIVAKTIINQLLDDSPELNIVVTTTTPTGAKQIVEGLGNKVTHHYSPCDLPGTIKRFTQRINPKVLIIIETELWPNWLHHMLSNNIPVILANARMSEKSAQKYSKISSLSRQMMEALTLVLPVSRRDAQHFIRLGVASEKCFVTGNLKFDQHFDVNDAESYYPAWAESSAAIWLAASTHKGEDEVLLKAHQLVISKLPETKLVIVPRHPERFDDVAEMIRRQGFALARRSDPETWGIDKQVLLGDTIGELMTAYQLVDVAFVAGSLVPIGGHNMIEPASSGKPVLSGPYVHNFHEIFHELERQGGAKTVSSEREISHAIIELLENEEQRLSMGQSAKAVVEHSRGALSKTIKKIEPFL